MEEDGDEGLLMLEERVTEIKTGSSEDAEMDLSIYWEDKGPPRGKASPDLHRRSVKRV